MITNDLLTTLVNEKIISGDRLSPGYLARLEANPILIKHIHDMTAYLQYAAPINVRIRCILQMRESQPLCETCGSPTQMAVSGPRRYTFPTFCSSKCFSSLDRIKNKREITNLERYDSPNFITSEYGKDVVKRNNLSRYGVENPLQLPEVQSRRDRAIVEKYGSVEEMRRIGAERRKQSISRRYGSLAVFNAFASEQHKSAMIEKYGVTSAFSLDSVQAKRAETMLLRYGTVHALQIPSQPDDDAC